MISVGIPCYRQAELIPRVIASVIELGADEILILDDGNAPPISTVSLPPLVRIVRHTSNRGLGAARNSLLSAARSDLVLFLDADVEYVTGCLPHLAARASEDQVAAVTGRALEADPRCTADRWRSQFWIQDHGTAPTDVAFAYGICSLWRRDAVLGVGGFDEKLRSHGEDIDLSLRLRAGGWRIVHDPALTVRHLRTDSVRSLLAMVWNHSYYFSTACLRHKSPLFTTALRNAMRWLPVSTGSSLLRHHSPRLAVLSIVACSVSLAARFAALLAVRRGFERGNAAWRP